MAGPNSTVDWYSVEPSSASYGEISIRFFGKRLKGGCHRRDFQQDRNKRSNVLHFRCLGVIW